MSYAKIVVIIDRFKHDACGNPVAHHTVYGYRYADQPTDSPTAELYQTRRRQQVGYGSNFEDWVGTALEKAGFPHASGQSIEGSRSEGQITFTFTKPIP